MHHSTSCVYVVHHSMMHCGSAVLFVACLALTVSAADTAAKSHSPVPQSHTAPATPHITESAPSPVATLARQEAERIYTEYMHSMDCGVECVTRERARVCNESALVGATTNGAPRISDYSVLALAYNTWSMLRDKYWLLHAMYPHARERMKPTVMMEDKFARHWAAFTVSNGIDAAVAWPLQRSTCEMMRDTAKGLAAIPPGGMTNGPLNTLIEAMEVGYVQTLADLTKNEYARWAKDLADTMQRWRDSHVLRAIPLEAIPPAPAPKQ